MSVELTMLFYSAVLFFVLIMIPATEAILSNGLVAQAGARDHLPEPTVFNRRRGGLPVLDRRGPVVARRRDLLRRPRAA